MANEENAERPVDQIFPGRREAIAVNACMKEPIGCGKHLLLSPISLNFKDLLSLKEYYISGLCQDCQDLIFNAPEE